MQSSDIDITTALANLRYRMQPRFDAAGIDIRWELPRDDASMPAAAPGDVFQWQRILLEAFTNILRHSHAKTACVVARAMVVDDGPLIDITIVDDGVGMVDGHGHGISNMRHRAHAIGAQLAFERNDPSGTAVKLQWPPRANRTNEASSAGAPVEGSAQTGPCSCSQRLSKDATRRNNA
jgi:signal transduction histidine kinase